jgi:hypothetical protein
MPTVNVDAASEYRVFFYLNNTTCVGAVQTAFQWDTGWTIDPNGELNNWLNCQTNQLNLTTPHGAGGPTDGTITTAFDLITTTFLLIVLWIVKAKEIWTTRPFLPSSLERSA